MSQTSPANPDPGRVLYHAAWTGNAKKVKELLASHAPISFVNPAGNSPLHIAFINKHDAIVDLLLEAIHSTEKFENLKNSIGLTHLHIACTRKNEQAIQSFLDVGANIQDTLDKDSPVWGGFNALHFAADFQSLQAIKVLLKAGMDQRVKTSEGKTALDLINQNLVEPLIMVDLLENIEDSSRRRNFSNFQIACLNEDKSLVQKFIDHGAAEMNSRTSHELSIASLSSPLHCAVASNCKEKVELLLQNGAKVEYANHDQLTPLHLALYEPSIIYEHSSRYLRQWYNVKIVELLYAAVKDKMIPYEDSNGLSFFHAAIARNDFPTVKKYLTEGKIDMDKSLSSNAGRFANYTPLHMAVYFNRPEIVEFLIEHGADVNACDKEHGTPLHMAFNVGHYNFIELFLTNKAKLDIVTPREQQTMLHLLVKLISSSFDLYNKLSQESISMYIEHTVKLGVDVNAKNTRGDTALHFFCSHSSHWAPYFQMLLDLGADVNLRNNEGKLPFDSSPWGVKQWKNKANAIFYHHVQKLKALGLKVDPENDETCKGIVEDGNCFEKEELNDREKQRLEEIKKLKSTTIGDVMSLYNFVKLDTERAMLYAACKTLKKIAKDEELKKKFPSYGFLIQLKYREARLGSAKKRLHYELRR